MIEILNHTTLDGDKYILNEDQTLYVKLKSGEEGSTVIPKEAMILIMDLIIERIKILQEESSTSKRDNSNETI